MICQWLSLTKLLLLLAVIAPFGAAKSDGPKIALKQLNTEPTTPFYFENSDTVLFLSPATGEVFQSFDGGVEWKVLNDELDAGEGKEGSMNNAAIMIRPHPFDNQKAYILGQHGTHWVTTDQGKTWNKFAIPALPSMFNDPLKFHGQDSKKVIFHGEQCTVFQCVETAFFTLDDFATFSPLRDNARGCLWAVGAPEFADSAAEKVNDRVFCIVHGLKNPFASSYRLVYSDTFFNYNIDDGIEVKLNEGRPVSGIINAASRTRYIVVAAKSQGTDELAMYVSDDAIVWHRAEFGNHKIEEDAYTVLEGTNYSIQVDVMNTDRPLNMGVLFTSNSNGTYFTRNIEHTNRDISGLVDFEKIADVQGIVLVNVVDNWEELEDPTTIADRKVISKISFDDGRTFQPLKVKDADLHLHSVTAFKNVGRVFSSPAPGIVMGVGNTGSYLKSYNKDGDLYVSDDAGVTWRLGLEKPHKYEMGNKGAVVAAIQDDGEPTNKIRFSINHGKDWESAELEHEIIPYLLTTTPDSTSLKFLLVGYTDNFTKWYVYSIDFEGLHERECKDSDFEDWPARLDEKGEPDCLMGHKQFYRRRKSDANCFITESLFKTPAPDFKPCKCTAEDFECDYNFMRSDDRKECIPTSALQAPEGTCKNDGDTFKGPSGWRLIPGNACLRDGGENLDQEIERSCKDALKAPTGDAKDISSTVNYIDSEKFQEFYYLERAGSSTGEDETIVMRTSDSKLYVTHDHGKTWTHELADTKIVDIAPHRYLNDRAFFLTSGQKHWLTINRANTFDSFTAPTGTNPRGLTLGYHSMYKDWMIWTGATDCSHSTCSKTSYYTKNRGDHWELLLRTVEKCEFMAREDRNNSNNLIFCDQHEGEDVAGQRMLLTSGDFFDTSKTPLSDIIDFATMAEFIIIATRNPENEDSMKVDASLDGITFADAEFPPNLEVPVQLAYTVLDSSTHSVFLHVTANNKMDESYGSIIKSNSNGTSYVLSINDVNRNNNGYVDFEKMQGLEGVALVNVVSNTKDVAKGSEKKLKSMITHNDGAQWTLIPPPEKDSEGKSYSCGASNGKPTDKCSLHLHGYTERRDPRDTFSSSSAIGLMFGVGNVGEALGSKSDGSSTFFSRDGGISWKEVKKGNYMWKFGDQGSVLVLVEELKPTRVIYFSVDEGETWEQYEFSDKEVAVQSLSTVPSDTSRNFLLWGKEVSSSKLVTINLDFSGLRDRTCNLDEDLGESEDYYMWVPKHPLQEGNCLFGHVEEYHRKKPSAHCWNDWSESHVHRISHNCTCTRQDFECDYNYEPLADGSCALVPGLPKPNAINYCKENPDAVEYWEPTGYRRIPLTTCTGGLNLDRLVSHPCPDHEEEYERKHGTSGVVIFFAIILPLAAAAGVGYWVYTRWDGKFGQIRLGEGPGGAQSSLFMAHDSPFIAVPVAIIAGTVAAIKVLPLLGMSLWRSASGYMHLPGRGGPRPYATRNAFAARRGDYTNVVDDEDELFGDEEFEDEEEES